MMEEYLKDKSKWFLVEDSGLDKSKIVWYNRQDLYNCSLTELQIAQIEMFRIVSGWGDEDVSHDQKKLPDP